MNVTEAALDSGGHCKKRKLERGTLESGNKGDGFQGDDDSKGKGKVNLTQSIGQLEKKKNTILD